MHFFQNENPLIVVGIFWAGSNSTVLKKTFPRSPALTLPLRGRRCDGWRRFDGFNKTAPHVSIPITGGRVAVYSAAEGGGEAPRDKP